MPPRPLTSSLWLVLALSGCSARDEPAATSADAGRAEDDGGPPASDAEGIGPDLCDGVDNDRDAMTGDGSADERYQTTCMPSGEETSCGGFVWRCNEGGWLCERPIASAEPIDLT